MDEPTSGSEPTSAETTGNELDSTAQQVRGSSVLLTGRMISLALNLLTQVLIVRTLTKSDFGAFAYGLSIVALGQTLVTLGHSRTITRFLAIYGERREHDKLVGTLVMETGMALSVGLALFAGVFGLQGWIAGSLGGDAAVGVIVILVLLAPIEAIDDLIEGTFAVFARPKAIFVRKYVVAPCLRLTVVLLLVLRADSVFFLAGGYVLAGLLGVSVYAAMLRRLMREQGLTGHLRRGGISMPVREVFGFSFPLLTTELVSLSMNTAGVLLLGHFHDAAEVGAIRAILPAAILNMLVSRSFELLFMPLASRLFARGDIGGMRHAYWQTAVWLAVLSFPVFLLTFVLAETTTVLLFGEQYRESATFLALLAFGYYFNASLGFNALTLQVFGRLRAVVLVNVAVACLNVALALLLIPPYGALGLAVAHAATLVTQNLLNQLLLGRLLGLRTFEARYAPVYAWIVGVTAVMWVIVRVIEPPLVIAGACAVGAAAIVLMANRGHLAIASTFPELRRVPLLGRLVS